MDAQQAFYLVGGVHGSWGAPGKPVPRTLPMPDHDRMARVEIHPFTAEHLPDAGRLLAERHRRHRANRPELSPAFEDAAAAEKQVAEARASCC